MTGRGRMAALLAATLLAAGPLAATAASPADAAAPVAAPAGSLAAAQALAAVAGVPVEATDLRTETSSVFANPTGTITMDVANAPIRVRQAAGWVPVDTTLAPNPDGTMSPRAANVGLRLSGGGAAGTPLVTLSRGSRSLTIAAPFALPAPTLAGGTATYPNVLSGVDLIVRADPEAFSEVLVVKSAAAAANPALTKLIFPVRTTGLTLQRRADGGLDTVTTDGETLFTGPAPLMWESVSSSRLLTSSAGFGDAALTTTSATSQASAPAEGAAVAAMSTAVSAADVTVSPDTALLRGAATTYPVYLDPSLAPKLAGWTMVNKTFPTSSNWHYTGDKNNAEGVGFISTALDGTHTKRLYYQFATSALNGRSIVKATLRAFETHAYSCTNSAIGAWQTGAVSASTTWNNQPGTIGGLLQSQSVAHGRVGCEPNGANVDFDVKAALVYSTTHNAATTTLKLQAGSETSNTSWKRFKRDATLSVEYNTTPATPSALHTIEPPTSCTTGTARPVIPNDPPKLVARLNDADGAAGQLVKASFEIYTSAGLLKTTLPTAAAKPGTDYVVQAPTLPDGTYKWRVRANDGVVWGGYSGWCEFTIDGTKPLDPLLRPAPATETAFYSHQLYSGTNAFFTVTPNDVSATRFKWSLNSPVPTSAFIDVVLHPTFLLPLTNLGPMTLRVWTFDAAGNMSARPGLLDFTVVAQAERGWWRLDQSSGTLAPDRVGASATAPNGAHAMTVTAPTWTDGRFAQFDITDRAVLLNGTTSTGVTATNDVVDSTTDVTLMAGVKLSPTSARAVAVSQETTTGVQLSLEAVPQTDAAGATEHHLALVARAGTTAASVVLPQAIQYGQWHHVVGSWFAQSRTLQLTVDGSDAVTIDADTLVGAGAPGGIRIGARRAGAVIQDFWPGTVDEVVVWNRAVTASEITQWFNGRQP